MNKKNITSPKACDYGKMQINKIEVINQSSGSWRLHRKEQQQFYFEIHM